LPIGLSGSRRPARASLIAELSTVDRLVLPEDDALQILLKTLQHGLSSAETVLGGMRAMVAMTCFDLFRADVFLRLEATSICIAPTSSITSIALSGSLRSLM
jgi:hypothetical protein